MRKSILHFKSIFEHPLNHKDEEVEYEDKEMRAFLLGRMDKTLNTLAAEVKKFLIRQREIDQQEKMKLSSAKKVAQFFLTSDKDIRHRRINPRAPNYSWFG